ncbi:hypothetical protein [Geothrix fuzhouensis]|uniref:hypothetical protein n=1 Tax=Geothrix fuzhouensis TaxID=2966451 RepID=UPI00214989EC|nr:hypothetical protein [Geothrix fuzhouensis]
MFAAFLFALLQTTPAAPPVTPPAALESPSLGLQAAHPNLAAKAPGKPNYGVVATLPAGKYLFTSLRFDLEKGAGPRILRIQGPVGYGPYYVGIQIRPWEPRPTDFKENFPPIMASAIDGSPAKKAGFKRFMILTSVNGSNFNWQVPLLAYAMTSAPECEVTALEFHMIGRPTKHTYRIKAERRVPPADPADGWLELITDDESRILRSDAIWDPTIRALLKTRSELPRFHSVTLELPDSPGKRQANFVRGLAYARVPGGMLPSLECWLDAPPEKSGGLRPEGLWIEPPGGFAAGQILGVNGQFFFIRSIRVDGASEGLTDLRLDPWKPNVESLLSGARPSAQMPPARSSQGESIEEFCNDTLVEWKTLTLPGELLSQDLQSTGNLVVRLEKGLLKLDLEVKGIRSRLDVAARAEAEHQAQAELAAKTGQPATQVQATPATESERLADLLEQRKAILMAILGSAKQSLANLRR